MFLQKENKSIDEIGMKEKIIYERRKSSLKEIFLAFLSPKKSREVQMAKLQKNSREVRSVKASLCTSFLKKGSMAVETALVLPLFFLGMVTLISFMDIYKLQTEHLSDLCNRAKQAGMYAYITGESGVEDITIPDVYTYKSFGGLVTTAGSGGL